DGPRAVHARALPRGARGDRPPHVGAARARAGAPRLAASGIHAPAARAARLPQPPPARILLDARARPRTLRVRRARDAALTAGGGGAGGRELPDRPPYARARAGLRRGRSELDRRGLFARLRARLPRGRGDVRDSPLASGSRARAVV